MHLNPVALGEGPFDRPRRNNAVGVGAESRSVILIPSNRICESLPVELALLFQTTCRIVFTKETKFEGRKTGPTGRYETRWFLQLHETRCKCNTMTTSIRREGILIRSPTKGDLQQRLVLIDSIEWLCKGYNLSRLYSIRKTTRRWLYLGTRM